jgi:hypothetical protein
MFVTQSIFCSVNQYAMSWLRAIRLAEAGIPGADD